MQPLICLFLHQFIIPTIRPSTRSFVFIRSFIGEHSMHSMLVEVSEPHSFALHLSYVAPCSTALIPRIRCSHSAQMLQHFHWSYNLAPAVACLQKRSVRMHNSSSTCTVVHHS